MAAMHINVKEIAGAFQDTLVISELRGAYPNVPYASDVDYTALIAGESDPMFITLPIAKVNAKSGNGRYYDEAFVMELMKQTLANKPIGLMGHMTEAERATAFKPEAVHWVGAVRDGDMIWGKGLVVGEAKARIARYKASGKSIATSIDAHADGIWDESLKAYRMRADTLRLSQIDLAPSDRAGIGDLARVPMITTELTQDTIEEVEEPEMDKLDVLNALTAEDARLLPKVVRDAILADLRPPMEVEQMQKVQAALGLDAEADVVNVVTEMVTAREQQRVAAIESRITELATAGIKVDHVREVVVDLVKLNKPTSIKEVEDAYKKVSESPSITELLKTSVQEQMGPPQRTPVTAQAGTAKYFSIPKEA
jgi:hypothetical protein